ncbi:MAG: PhzF family phenazine biosynthesis protein [Leptolyngbya sp. SIO4C1]|nr:PhzF family phenazine biosynthesis protein [Leptolyngbya sp. SIO4C1]
MALTIIQVDAFTNEPFKGNPAAICVTEQPLADALMQSIAAEMNLSETAFLYPEADAYRLRWFTPLVEVDLCGHATLASAHVLWSEGYLSADQTARFQTRSGWLMADKQDSWIEMNFPAQPVQASYVTPQLIASLCCQGNISHVLKNDVNYLVELQNEAAVHSLKPDFDKLRSLPVQGVIATALADSDAYDFVSRYFAPAAGINEDPVTGSAHASLGPYWGEKLDKSAMLAQQVSARGGQLKVRNERDRVYISGQAVTVMRGTLADL